LILGCCSWVDQIYIAIKDDAITGDVSYSRLMKAKLTVSYLLSLIYIAPIPLAFTVNTFWLFPHPFYSLLYLIFSLVWLSQALLMRLEQERNLTQVWYCHQFFWVTNLFFLAVFTAICLVSKVYKSNDYSVYAFSGVQIFLSFLMFCFMMKTKSLRLRKLKENMHNTSISSEKLLPKPIIGEIEVILEYRITKKNEVFFKVNTDKSSNRVKRNFKEFFQIEQYLVDYIDDKMPELRNALPSIEKSYVASLETENQLNAYENRLKNVDNFLQVLAETPEFWTRDVLIFLGIDKSSDQAIYLQKRNELLQRKNQ
jgi:hypothetical protein